MGKAARATAITFLLGGGVMAVLGSVLGAYAEPTTLALVGAGLWTWGHALAALKLPARSPGGGGELRE